MLRPVPYVWVWLKRNSNRKKRKIVTSSRSHIYVLQKQLIVASPVCFVISYYWPIGAPLPFNHFLDRFLISYTNLLRVIIVIHSYFKTISIDLCFSPILARWGEEKGWCSLHSCWWNKKRVLNKNILKILLSGALLKLTGTKKPDKTWCKLKCDNILDA